MRADIGRQRLGGLHQAGEATQHSGDIAFATPSANWADHQA
ncbi:MAG TPA: hypothetical protein VNV87_00150 [Acidimicrobiales bacterium]|nr:hypothetical protein [Acidimicrobiales bacterium]